MKGSLRNSDGGFEFQLRNTLGSGYAHRMLPLSVDGYPLPMEATFFYTSDEREVEFSNVSEQNTFTLGMNKTIQIWVDMVTLPPGPHKIEMGFEVPALGAMKFDFTDIVANE
ncbi:MAG: hypothetical protein FJ319_02875 [SAR202 cluster bacterium]|nr:hypothetical protein [SAR202 cluster bacterium]